MTQEEPAETEKGLIMDLRKVLEVIDTDKTFYTVSELIRQTGIGRRRMETILSLIEVVSNYLQTWELGVVQDPKGNWKGLMRWKKVGS